MGDEIIVGIGDIMVSHNPIILTALGLGSCIAVALYDKDAHIGGLAHIMLPDSKYYCGKLDDNRTIENLTKYADVAIPKMIKDMEKLGCKRTNIRAKLAGGAQMFQEIKSDVSQIGIRNADAIKMVLKENNIPIDAEELGGNSGRSIRFDTATQKIKIKTIKEEKEI